MSLEGDVTERSSSVVPVPSKSNKSTSDDCVSSAAVLIARGVGAGIAWTLAFDAYALLQVPSTAWIEANPSMTPRRAAANVFKYSLKRNVMLFTGFLGIFSGVSCAFEKARGKKDLFNPFAGGFSAGLVVFGSEVRNPRYMLAAAAICGTSSMFLHGLVPSSSSSDKEK